MAEKIGKSQGVLKFSWLLQKRPKIVIKQY